MKRILILILLIISSVTFINAQKGPLNGSGKIISKTVDYKNFDKISLTDLAGKVEVEVGKPFSIIIDIDDNLESLLAVSAKNGNLEVKLKGNENNKMYIENTNIKIKISLPEISVMEHRGNDDVTIIGIAGRYFRMQNSGNGNVELKGTIDVLDIKKSGNGDINAANLLAKNVTVSSSGNGDVIVNAATYFKANGSGNGNIKNTGSALASAESSNSGNGEIKDASNKAKVKPYPNPIND